MQACETAAVRIEFENAALAEAPAIGSGAEEHAVVPSDSTMRRAFIQRALEAVKNAVTTAVSIDFENKTLDRLIVLDGCPVKCVAYEDESSRAATDGTEASGARAVRVYSVWLALKGHAKQGVLPDGESASESVSVIAEVGESASIGADLKDPSVEAGAVDGRANDRGAAHGVGHIAAIGEVLEDPKTAAIDVHSEQGTAVADAVHIGRAVK